MTDRLDIMVGHVRLAGHVSGAPDAPPIVLLHALGEGAVSRDPDAAERLAEFAVAVLTFLRN